MTHQALSADIRPIKMNRSNPISQESVTKLLRFYLHWPQRYDDTGDNTEAELFYDWLKETYPDLAIVQSLKDKSFVEQFFSENKEVIAVSKELKPARQTEFETMRKETRISTSTQVFIVVASGDGDSDLTGVSLRGTALDITIQGMRVQLPKSVPAGSIVNMTVAPVGFPIVLFNLIGEIRWQSSNEGNHQVGIKIQDTEDFDKWAEEFPKRYQ